jgi:hypothetical protein
MVNEREVEGGSSHFPRFPATDGIPAELVGQNYWANLFPSSVWLFSPSRRMAAFPVSKDTDLLIIVHFGLKIKVVMNLIYVHRHLIGQISRAVGGK